ncbi:MAG: amidohydrolase family protein [Hyphomicrobiaceae bacterium]
MMRTTEKTNHYIAKRLDWLARVKEPILEPDLPSVDPHHHLWDRPNWRYLHDDLNADTSSGHNIVATVFVQCGAYHKADGPEELRPVGETQFVAGTSAMAESGLYGKTRWCEGIVGTADMFLGDRVEPVLEAHVKAANGRFRGIRHITAWDADKAIMNPSYSPPQHALKDPKFQAALKTLGKMGFTFDGWMYHPQISDLATAAAAVPDTRMVLDHVGGPVAISAYEGKREAEFPKWAASIKELAKRPNVYVKLGGLGMRINGYGFEDAKDPPTSDMLAAAWKPYIETCIEAFGADRCMYESNFPVDKGSYSYPIFWNACKKLSKGASADEKRMLFAGTAQKFYRLQKG